MSVMNIYAVRDTKTQAYMKPFFLQNDAVANRAVTDAVRDPQSNFSLHPEDYQLYRLGAYDDQTGKIESCPPEFMSNLNDFCQPGGDSNEQR